jgi:hypothetical protein
MLSPDSTGTIRGIDPMVGYGSVTRERPWNLWGYYGTGNVAVGQSGRFLFDDRAKHPVMTYAQLQFIKAEAALRMGDQALAKQAYLNGIASHIDFVNAQFRWGPPSRDLECGEGGILANRRSCRLHHAVASW